MLFDRPARAIRCRLCFLAAVIALAAGAAPLGLSVQDNHAEAERRYADAVRLRLTGDLSTARRHAQQALASHEHVDPQSAAVARALLQLAQIEDARADFVAAEQLYQRARAIADRAAGSDELLLAQILDSYASNLIARARFEDAAPLVQTALATRQRVAGASHPLVAASLGTLADLQHESAQLQEAASTAERALAIAEKTYGPADIVLGEFINRVARSELALGNFARAEALYRDTLAVREKAAGPETLAAAESLGGLARVALLTNDNVTSEERHRRSLAIRERRLGPDHPLVANDVFNLGLISYRRRDFTTALALYGRAQTIRQHAFGSAHPSIAIGFNNLGLVYWRQLDYPHAEEFFSRALALSEQLYGADSLRVTNALGNLGIIAKETGNYPLAEARYRRALAIKEKHLGAGHPEVITLVESLAILFRDRGQYAQAEQMFQRVITLTAGALGPEHPFVARHLANVSQMYWAMNLWDEALAARRQAVAIDERNLPLELAVGSERQKLAYFEPFLADLEETIAFHAQQPRERAGARDLALTTLLQRKGRIFDALADNSGAFRTRATPDNLVLLDQLSKVTSELAATVLGESNRLPAAERRSRAAQLSAERERLEIEIQQRSAGYLATSQPLTLAAVQDAIPAEAALIEFAIYRPFDPHAAVENANQLGSPRYIAYVVRQRGDARWRDLGPAADIDRALERFQRAVAEPRDADVMHRATELHGLLMAPLVPLLEGTTHLLVSPDGALNLIPFEALRSKRGRYLVEDWQISYLTSGRDLVRMTLPRPRPGPSVIVADAAFGAATSSSTFTFAPLAGTAGEAKRILMLVPDATMRTGHQASERTLKAVHAPRILHIATHGFFLQPSLSLPATSQPRSGIVDSAASTGNPLLRSGLALAGANLPRAGGDDGLLTALEAANLDLWGTKLVTLSACDTGVGLVRNGEGVYGLRRAFFLAGAQTLVMSLWPVSDLITRELMAGYYAGLQRGLGRGAALRSVQLQLLHQKGRTHPFYWASFIQAGEWASLDGRR
jgi:CHAT domain-containing protein/Tfp pilus assembly protein PilF